MWVLLWRIGVRINSNQPSFIVNSNQQGFISSASIQNIQADIGLLR